MPRKNFIAYEAACALARERGIATREAWRKLARDEYDLRIPINPERVYSQFTDWGEFLGVQWNPPLPPEKMVSFECATTLVRARGCKSARDYQAWAQEPDFPTNLPRNPARSYKSAGWAGWPAFLGVNPSTGSERQFAAYDAVREWARAQGLSNRADWRALVTQSALPEGVPTHPELTYREVWPGWAEFLAADKPASHERFGFAPYERAAAWAQAQGIRSASHWRTRRAQGLPASIPVHPERTYRAMWQGWSAFLGLMPDKERRHAKLLPFEACRDATRELGVRSSYDWRTRYAAGELPEGFPSDPAKVYAGQWRGWPAFLGTGKPESA